MLTAIEVMQRMLIKELSEIGFFADHVLSRRDKNSTGLQHPKNLPGCAVKIASVMQNGPLKYDVEGAVAKR